MTGALLAAVAAAFYSASDLTSTFAVKRVPPALVSFWAHATATAVLLPPALVLAAFPGAGAALIALAAGLVAGAGVVAYYAALRSGPASIVSPVAATGIALPVLLGVALGQTSVVIALAGTALLLAGLTRLTRATEPDGDRGEQIAPRALLLAGGAALTFGAYFVLVDLATSADGGHPLWIAALVVIGSGLAAVPPALAAAPRTLRPGAGTGRSLALAGALLAVGDLALAAAMGAGDVALVSVIAAADPAFTVLAAHVVLHERLDRGQAVGVGLTVAGVLAVAAG